MTECSCIVAAPSDKRRPEIGDAAVIRSHTDKSLVFMTRITHVDHSRREIFFADVLPNWVTVDDLLQWEYLQ